MQLTTFFRFSSVTVIVVLSLVLSCSSNQAGGRQPESQQKEPAAAGETFEDARQREELQHTIDKLEASLRKAKAALAELSAPRPRTPDTPQGKIVNGILTAEYPAAGALMKEINGRFGSWCSGTLVGSKTFLTAGHCVSEDGSTAAHVTSAAKFRVFFQNAGVFNVSSIALHSDFRFPTADVAVLTLQDPVMGIGPISLGSDTATLPGTRATIVGFGRSGGTNFDYGLKRLGSVTTASCAAGFSNDTLVCWNFDNPLGLPGENSNTCNADSGGGLYSGVPPRIVGITSGGVRSSCLQGDHSYDASIFKYASWIKQKAASDLGVTASGLPAVGSNEVSVIPRVNDLNGEVSERRYEVDIPQNTRRVRFTFNAIDTPGNATDFDLYVNPTAPAAPNANVCARDGVEQFGGCDLEKPAAGKWHILIKRKTGEGYFQFTTTLFR